MGMVCNDMVSYMNIPNMHQGETQVAGREGANGAESQCSLSAVKTTLASDVIEKTISGKHQGEVHYT